jgi:hypothetical protein
VRAYLGQIGAHQPASRSRCEPQPCHKSAHPARADPLQRVGIAGRCRCPDRRRSRRRLRTPKLRCLGQPTKKEPRATANRPFTCPTPASERSTPLRRRLPQSQVSEISIAPEALAGSQPDLSFSSTNSMTIFKSLALSLSFGEACTYVRTTIMRIGLSFIRTIQSIPGRDTPPGCLKDAIKYFSIVTRPSFTDPSSISLKETILEITANQGDQIALCSCRLRCPIRTRS